MAITDLAEFTLSSKALEQLHSLNKETKWKHLHSRFCISFSFECLKCATVSQDLETLRNHIGECFHETEPKRKESHSKRKRLKTTEHKDKCENSESAKAKSEEDKKEVEANNDHERTTELSATSNKVNDDETFVKKVSKGDQSAQSNKRLHVGDIHENNEKDNENGEIEASPAKRKRGRPSKKRSEDQDIVKFDEKPREVETILPESSHSDATPSNTSTTKSVNSRVKEREELSKKHPGGGKDKRADVKTEKRKINVRENKQTDEAEPVVFEVTVKPRGKPQKIQTEVSENATKPPLVKPSRHRNAAQINTGTDNEVERIVTLDLDCEGENEACYDENVVSLTSSLTVEKQIKQLRANGKLNVKSHGGTANRNLKRVKPDVVAVGKAIDVIPKVRKASAGRDLNSEEIKAKTCAICKEQQPSIKVGNNLIIHWEQTKAMLRATVNTTVLLVNVGPSKSAFV